MFAGQLALVLAAEFAGAAFYINVAEHPARCRQPWLPRQQRWAYLPHSSHGIGAGSLAQLLYLRTGPSP